MNTTIIDACFQKKTEYTPVWFMRQAGRYMPSYREIKGSRSVKELSMDPESVAKIVCNSAFELGTDAAIIYADITFSIEPMGIKYKIEENFGPVAENPIRDPEDINNLSTYDPEEDLEFVFKGIDLTIETLNDKIPLIGFSGAPFTLASYMIDGKQSKTLEKTRIFMKKYPEYWERLMEMLSTVVIRYLNSQIKHGVSVIQLFDSWAGYLSKQDYDIYVKRYNQKILSSISSRVPRIYFCENIYHLLESVSDLTAEVISVDWRTSIAKAWETCLHKKAIQGNLDPAVAAVGGNILEKEVRNIISEASEIRGHIFNLGHGVLPETKPENLKRIVKIVHELTRGKKV